MPGLGSEGLTSMEDREMQLRINRTHPGQAHWGESDDKTCRECSQWGGAHRREFKRDSTGELVDRRCFKATSISGGHLYPGVPFDARACRFFEARKNPPPVERKRDE